jgi:NADH dehydrogenase
LLTFAIVGGGPTGVEFAGALAELIRGPLVKDYPGLDFREVQVVLLEALDGLLPAAGAVAGVCAFTTTPDGS